ncbi:MAG: 16S rRNA (guanine(966)-N(2))-methyltransferase RsmD [Erysipelotrichaceae bacterium]|jgi:16S rRNA (guanine(966)-N(2))-methyltransferase RsmD|nr:16S rRNA (guanine(966)-N(2))-methyltransferase RsmD [Erysipelotrichaceae bacterium]
MRIIAGEYRSRLLKTLPGSETRPTLDKVREAIFSSLGSYFKGGTMLDLFAGSGAMGLEALSRGMSHIYLADNNPQAIRIIYENIRTLKVEDQCTVWRMDFISVLKKSMALGISYDLVYLDPPYKKQQNDLILETIEVFGLLKPKGFVIVESLKDDVFLEQTGGLKQIKEAFYGKTKVTYYKKEE